jgi:hypothetical protein
VDAEVDSEIAADTEHTPAAFDVTGGKFAVFP